MTDWKMHGIRVVRANELDTNTPQTPGMTRAAAITNARAGASKLWAGTVVVDPDAKTGAHHHGELETVLYIVRGRARFRWGEQLEYFAEAGPGDFIFVPPFVPHQEMNASPGYAGGGCGSPQRAGADRCKPEYRRQHRTRRNPLDRFVPPRAINMLRAILALLPDSGGARAASRTATHTLDHGRSQVHGSTGLAGT